MRENSAYAAVSAMTMTSGTTSMPADRGDRAAQAEEAVAEHQREVDDVRAGQHLAERQHLDELLARQPALALDELALRDGEDAAEALQREAVEGEEEVGGRGRACAPRPRGAAVGRARRSSSIGSLMPRVAARDRPRR